MDRISQVKTISMDEVKKIVDETYNQLTKDYFIPFFQSLDGQYKVGVIKNRTPKIKVIKIDKIEDLECIPSNSPGFYVILTDYMNGYTEKNLCNLKLEGYPNVKAIYRGEAYNVRLRLMSHLFKDTYDYNKVQDSISMRKRDDNYTVCLKLEDQVTSGINLDKEKKLSKANWFVAYHGMRGTDNFIRKSVEKAFDIVYGKPLCSRD